MNIPKVGYRAYLKPVLNVFIILVISIAFPAINSVPAASYSDGQKEKITLQLRWKHQFQFAGYYAASEKGFYAEEGLDVSFKERIPGKNQVESVLNGEAEYGIDDATLLLRRLEGKPVVLLVQIFQHSPLILLTRHDSGIISPFELVDKKVMFDLLDAPITSMFLEALGSLSRIKKVPHSMNYKDLVEGKVDAISAYITDQPYYLKQKGIPFNIINPQSYGIDFYGDNLFTTEKEIREHPERVEKMRRASLKGWEYALKHQDEIIDLIIKKYNPRLDRGHLEFEARMTEMMILPDLIELGNINSRRFDRIAETYARLGIAIHSRVPDQFFHKQSDETNFYLTDEERTWLAKYPEIEIGIMDAWPPLNFVDNQGNPKGIGVDYITAINKRLDNVLKIVPEHFEANYNAVKDKQRDAVMDITRREERIPFFHFTIPYMRIPHVIIGLKDGPFFASEKDLKGRSVALERGFYNVTYFKKNYPGTLIREYESTSAALGAVLRREADAYVGNRTVASYLIEQELMTGLKLQGRSEKPPVELSIGVRKDWPELAEILNRALASLTREEESRIRKKWLFQSDQLMSLSAAEQAWIKKHPVITVHNEEDGVPFNFNENGIPKGFSIDYMNLIAQKVGLKVQYKTGSWDALLKMVKNSSLDVMLNIARSKEREKFLHFSSPYYNLLISLFVRDDVEKIRTVKDLYGKRVAVPKGSYVEGLIKKHPEIKILSVNNTREAVVAVSTGNADALYNIVTVVNYMTKKLLIENLRLEGEVGLSDGKPMQMHIAVNKDNAMLASIIDKGLAAVEEPEVAQLRIKWLGDKTKTRMPRIELTAKEKEFIDEHPVIKVANDREWPPFDFYEFGRARGYSIDYLRVLAEIIGIKLEFVQDDSWEKLINQFESKKLDVITAYEYLPSHQKFAFFTEPYLETYRSIVIRKGTPFLKNYRDLYGKKVAVVKGYDYEKVIKEKHKDIDMILVDTPRLGLEMLSFGQVDAFLENSAVAAYLFRKHGFPNLILAGNPDLPELEPGENIRIGVRKDWPELNSMFSKAMKLVPEATLIRLGSQWLAKENRQAEKMISLTKEEEAWLADHPVVKVANEMDFPPFDFAVGDRPQGYSIDLLNLMAQKIGLNIEYVNGYTWKELVELFKRHELELLHSLTQTPAREAFGLFSNDYHRSKQFFVTQIENPEIKVFSDLFGKTVAVGKAWKSERFIAENFPRINLLRLNSLEEMLEAVSKGDAYATIANISALQYMIKKKGMSDLKLAGWAKELDQGKTHKYHFMAQKDSPELISMLNKALAIISTKERNDLEEKWFGSVRESRAKVDLTPEEQAYLTRKGSIRMSVLPDWLPYERISEDGLHEGIGEEIIQLIAKRLDMPVELLPTLEWRQSLENIKNRKCDILPIAMDVPSRRGSMDFTRPYLIEPFVIVTRADELFIKDTRAIGSRKVGIVKGAAFAEVIRQRHPEVVIVDVNSVKEGLEQVRQGELFGYIDSMPAAGYFIQKFSMLDLKIAGKLDFNLEISIACRNDEPLLASIMQKAVDSISEEERREIIGHWMSIRFEQGFDYTLLWKIMSGVAILFFIILFWNRHLSHMNRKIKQANFEAQEANRVKSEFLANMSHEIRTPLNAITGFSELLSSTFTDEKQKSYLEAIKSSGKNLMLLINDILDLSKIEAGKMNIQYSTVDLKVLFDEVGQVFALQISKKGLKFIIDIPKTLPPAMQLDEIRLRQVLLNIVGNAVKFTETGYIKLSVEIPESAQHQSQDRDILDEMHILVEDTGIGIADSDMKSIFDSFKQQADQDSFRYGGTGLGLAICRRLVEMMNGRIELESTIGKGSLFKIIIHEVAVYDKGSMAPREEAHIKDIRFEKGRVLVVDDVESNRLFLKEFLDSVNLEVLEAQNGHEAAIITPEYRPDLILMDIRMPVMNGFESARLLKNDNRSANIPIVAVTASSSSLKQSGILKMGFDGFLSKPIDINQLFSELLKYFKPVQKPAELKQRIEIPELESFKDISAEVKSNIPELLKTLESDLMGKWALFRTKQPIKDVREFAGQLDKLGKRYNVNSLSRYGESLLIHANNFDVKEMKNAIGKFPELIENLKRIKESHDGEK